MPRKPLDKDTLKREHAKTCPKYERLAGNLQQALEGFLNDSGIDFLDVNYRIKNFDSFWDKAQRKSYKDPLQEIEDICGLRIICYYPPDLGRISEIINKEFDVIESIDKAELLEPDRFGYRALHFTITVKKEWAKAPNYRGLNVLKAEIQVCTILMHAWADIEHKLAYKKEEHVPDQFKRKLYQLSALFEMADAQFDSLRKEKEGYIEHLVSKEAKKRGRFDVTQSMNIDSLQAFLDFYFPDRNRLLQETSDLFDEIIEYEVSIRELVEAYERVEDILPAMELEDFKIIKVKNRRWAQVGVVRAILDLTNDDYWQYRKEKGAPEEWILNNEKRRAKLSKKNR
ncbi:MAG: hypothetical protein V3R93_06415 [Candidatus Hydrothermarchaeaceae archaeon]